MIASLTPDISKRPAGAQIVRDVSNDYVLLEFLINHGWRITEIDDKVGWYWARRVCKPLKH